MNSLLLWLVWAFGTVREKISYSLPLQVLRYRMRWFKVSEGGRLLKAPSVMSSMRSAVRDLQVLAMVIAFVGISRGEWVGRVGVLLRHYH